MAVKGASTIPKFRLSAAPKTPKPKALVIKGPGVPKLKAPGVQKASSLPSPSVRLAKAAAGARTTHGKRNPDYPTP